MGIFSRLRNRKFEAEEPNRQEVIKDPQSFEPDAMSQQTTGNGQRSHLRLVRPETFSGDIPTEQKVCLYCLNSEECSRLDESRTECREFLPRDY
jgi:hypothetical protein